MKKMQYIQPKMEISEVGTTHLMDGLLGSPTAPEPAPARADMPAQGAGYKPF